MLYLGLPKLSKMHTMGTQNITSQSIALLLKLAGKGKEIFTFDEAKRISGLKVTGLKSALNRLMKKGWIKRLEKSKYLIVPLEAGLDREWTLDGLIIASYIVWPYAIAYWTALMQWDLTEQIPRIIFVQTTKKRKSKQKEILGVRFQFIKLKNSKFFGIKSVFLDDQEIKVTDIEKTIVDCFDHPDLCGGVIETSKCLYNAILKKKFNWSKVLEYALRIGNSAVLKRMGYVSEMEGILPNTYAEKFKRFIKPGFSKLDPTLPKRGTYLRKWQLLVNVPKEAFKTWKMT